MVYVVSDCLGGNLNRQEVIMAYQFTAREEFLVNSHTNGNQYYSDITALSGGGFIVVWTDRSGSSGDADVSVRAQIYDASGAPRGGEFLVNTRTEFGQSLPSVSELSNGNVVIAWQDSSDASASTINIKAQVFTSAGAKVGDEFLVNTFTNSWQYAPVVAGLDGGNFVVSWMDYSGTLGDASSASIKAQLFSPAGAKIGSEFVVNTQRQGTQADPAVTKLAGGGFLVSWTDTYDPGFGDNDTEIKAQILSSSGAKIGGELQLNTTMINGQVEPAVAGLSGGGFVAVWVSYVDLPGGGVTMQVLSQVFDASGAKTGGEVTVHATGVGNQLVPDVAALEDGGFVVTWQDDTQTLVSTYDVKAQLFDANGNPVGGTFVVNVETAAGQGDPVVAGLKGGGFAIVWTDYSGTLGDSSNAAVKARIFSPDPTEDADVLTGTPGDDSIEALGGDDTVDGANGQDILRGGDGADVLYGGLRNDLLVGDDGNDKLYGGDDIDTVRGEAGDDLLSGGAGGDSLNGGTGNDTLLGGARWDSLVGGQGDDWLDGGLDNDQMFGLAGNDVYSVDHVGDRVYEVPDEGNDTVRSSIDFALTPNVETLILTGTADLSGTGNGISNSLNGNSGNNLLEGGLGNDSLYGWDGDDTLSGGQDHDRLSGGNGSDTLTGGHGQDALGGGAGADAFVFSSVAVNGHDHVVDFVHGVDRLVFSGADYGFSAGHVLTASEFTQGAVAVGASAQFVWDAGGQRLYWDADGDGAGAAFELALISNGATVTSADLVFT